MSFLRSAERRDVVGQLRSAERYQHLSLLADPTDPFLREKPSLQAVRDHIVELASADSAARI